MDTETARFYVADRDNNRIDVFENDGSFVMAFGWGVDTGANAFETCTTATGCQAGIAGTGAGQFNSPSKIAVDNDAGSASRHDIYVTDNSLRVQKFDPAGIPLASYPGVGECALTQTGDAIAVGPGGIVYLTEIHSVIQMDGNGACVQSTPVVGPTVFVGGTLAVDSTGAVYTKVVAPGAITIKKYDLAGPTLVCEISSPGGLEPRAVAIDAANHVLVAQQRERANAPVLLGAVAEYDSACNPLRRFGYSQLGGEPNQGLAVHSSAGGDVVVSENAGPVKYLDFPPPGPIAPAFGLEVGDLGSVRAKLIAEVNPEGKATSYHFDYVDQDSFETEGGFASPNTKSTPITVMGPTDFELHSVEVQIGCLDPITEIGSGKCLSPETKYRFRVVATNADGAGEGSAEGPEFETKKGTELLATYASEVGPDTARLSAEVNPRGIPSTGYFEYVDDATFQQSGGTFVDATQVPNVGGGAGALNFGGGESPVARSVTVSPLAPATTYHYRAVVDNPLIAPVLGPEQTFTTFALAVVPHCAGNEAFRIGPSALLPDCRAYELVSPLEKNNGDVIPLDMSAGQPATLDQSSLAGSKLAYGSYRAFGDAESAPYTSQYIAERGEGGWSSHAIAPPRTNLNLEGLNMLDTEFKAFSDDLCQAWIRTVSEPVLAPGGAPGFPNLYRRHDDLCGAKSYEALTTTVPTNVDPQAYSQALELQGVSADGTAAIYTADEKLSADAPPQPPDCDPVEVIPGPDVCRKALYLHTAGSGLQYLCLLPSGLPVDGPCSAGTGLGSAAESRAANLTNALSEDGQRVYWSASTSGPGKIYLRLVGAGQTLAVSEDAETDAGTTKSQYWSAAADGSSAIFTTGGSLYRFEVGGEVTTEIAAGVLGVLGASEDASFVYFASTAAIGGANAEGRSPVAGKANLYLEHGGTTSFIMTLAESDLISAPAPISLTPQNRSTRVSPDGTHAAWTSAASPTGYDNLDAASGKPDVEVFRYDSAAEELRCVSCNPTGGRPSGKRLGTGTWAAATLPVFENSLYAARALSDDGSRIYFESTDALVARDNNGIGDLYQWEEPGTGECKSTSPTFSAAAGGCIDLISTGQSTLAVRFVDASPSGDDVFFATLESIRSEDYGLIDIYDARAGGGFPAVAPPQPECEGESCQNPGPAPTRGSFSSSQYQGPGNLPPTKPAKNCPKGKKKVKKNGKVTCVKKKKGKKQNKSGRAPR